MRLQELMMVLPQLNKLIFQKPDGTYVPAHFHITEVGIITRHFIDCGGTVRKEQRLNIQLWEADDFDHRLTPAKFKSIIEEGIVQLTIDPNLTIEVEYQQTTIGKYGLAFDGQYFQLLNLSTACLAEDSCGIPSEKQKKQLSELGNSGNSCCSPG